MQCDIQTGLSYEAQAFAAAVDEFAKLGATVVGVSNDKIEVLDKFSIDYPQGLPAPGRC